jgi:hypothetical protein
MRLKYTHDFSVKVNICKEIYMFKAIKEFFTGKKIEPVVEHTAPYKVEPPVVEAKPAVEVTEQPAAPVKKPRARKPAVRRAAAAKKAAAKKPTPTP